MSILVDNCRRCGFNYVTFDVTGQQFLRKLDGWQNWYEVFCACRHCRSCSIFVISMDTNVPESLQQRLGEQNGIVAYEGSLSHWFTVDKVITLRDQASVAPPEHLPENINSAFNEGATCLAVGCFNAASTMFRLCIDLATRPMLPDPNEQSAEQPSDRQRRDLGLRLPWLFDQGLLPKDLQELARCIREDGNDGAHQGTLQKADAEDLLDFIEILLKRLYTEPARLALAEERRGKRRTEKE